MSTLKRSIINMVTGGLGYVIPMILNLLFTPLLLSKLGEGAYGLQSLVNVIIGYLMVADMGMDIPIIKYVAEYSAKNDWQMLNKILNNTLQVYLIIGFLGAIIIGSLTNVFIEKIFSIPIELQPEAQKVFLLAAIGFLGSVLSMWGRAACNGLQRYDISNGVNIIFNFLSTVIGILLVVLGYGVVGFIASKVISSFFSAFVYFYLSRKLLPIMNFSFGFDTTIWKLLKSQIGYGFILRISGILSSGLDRTLIGSWIGVAAVGVYAVPFLIANSISYLLSSMTHFIFPMTSALHSTNKTEELVSLYLKSSKFILVISTLIFFPLILFGDKFLFLWVGEDIASKASVTLVLLCASYYLNAIFYLMANVFMIGIGKINVFTKFSVSKSIVMAIGFLFLIKSYGITGAGIAMLFSCIVDILFFMVTIKKYLQITISRIITTSYSKPLALSLAMGAACYFVRPMAETWMGLIMSCGIFIIGYMTLGYFTNIFEDEKKITKKLLSRVSLGKK